MYQVSLTAELVDAVYISRHENIVASTVKPIAMENQQSLHTSIIFIHRYDWRLASIHVVH